MIHLLLTPVVFLIVGPPIGGIIVMGGFWGVIGGYAVGSWPALVASAGYMVLSMVSERVLRRAELPAKGGSLIGVFAAIVSLGFCFPSQHWWQLSQSARDLLFPGIVAGAAAGALSAVVASKLAHDMAPD